MQDDPVLHHVADGALDVIAHRAEARVDRFQFGAVNHAIAETHAHVPLRADALAAQVLRNLDRIQI